MGKTDGGVRCRGRWKEATLTSDSTKQHVGGSG